MISRPLSHSVFQGEDKEILNSFNLSFSKSSLEEILSEESNQISSFERCQTCKAVLSERLITNENEKSKNSCKFCKNPLEVLEKQLKQMRKMNEDKSYFLDVNKVEMKAKASTNVLIVICLDYSSSMNVTYTPGPNSFGKEYLMTKMKKEEQNYISRKQLLLVNLEKQLKVLFDSNSKYNYQIFVITFASEVIMYGHGSKQNNTIELDKKCFTDLSQCYNFGKSNASKVFDKNKDSNLQSLFNNLHAKDPEGLTSLGPAVACGLGVIAALKPELSQLYIFTDGVANNGIGALKEANEPESIDIEAQKIYEELGDFGVNLGVVFHIIGFADQSSQLEKLEVLLKAKGSRLEKIKTPLHKERGKELTYDENELNNILKSALTVSSNTYGILVKLKIYSMNEAELSFCKETNSNITKKNTGTTTVHKKRFTGISEKTENVACKYKATNPKSMLFFQFQLVYTLPKNGEKIFIVVNLSSEVKDSFKYDEVNLESCNIIMMKDAFENNENLYKNYIQMMYLCKHWGIKKKDLHQTFVEAEKKLKAYITEIFGQQNNKDFETLEKKAIEIVNQDKDQEETIKRHKNVKGKVIEVKGGDDDENTINRRNRKAFHEEEGSINMKKKKNDNSYKSKKKINEEEIKEEETLPKNTHVPYQKEKTSMLKTKEKMESEVNYESNKNAKKFLNDDSDDDEMTYVKKKVVKKNVKEDSEDEEENAIPKKKIDEENTLIKQAKLGKKK